MLSARHDKSKAGQPKAALPPPAQLAAARAERRAAEGVRTGVLPAASAPATLAGSARIIAFPGPALRAAAAVPDHSADLPGQPQRSMAGASQRRLPATLQAVPTDTAKCLTVADRIALLEWSSQGSGGYARVALEDGIPGAAPDRSGYILLYRQHDRFATLGLTRRGNGILVWRCSDGTACGTYPTMAAALAALPLAAKAS